MGVVIVQPRATAHVYRIFGALIVLLILMALAVVVTRLRSDRQGGSPYGALASLNGAAAPPLPATALPAVASAEPALGAVAPAGAAPPPGPGPAVPTANMTDQARSARVIALDKAAAGSAIPQPAPPAVVQAAAKAAATPPVVEVAPPPAAAPLEPVAQSTPATVAAPAPVAVASRQSAPPANNAAPPPPPASGRVNINTASADQLNRLGGGMIGAWIIRHRPYRSIDDLVARRVLKARDFARIHGSISTD